MICIETQYLSINRILLLALGLWPHQQSRFTQFQFIFLSTILMTSIIFQLTTFMTTRCTSDVIATVLSSTSFLSIFMIKYYTFGINVKPVKELLITLQHVCNKLKDKNEIAIIDKYGKIAKRYTLAITTVSLCGMFTFIIIQFWNTFHVALSVNASRSRRMQFATEYFADQEKYFILILLHMNTAICIGATAMMATGTMLIAFFKFMCGMLKISSYRIERAVKISVLQNVTSNNKILRSEDLICAVDIHRQAIKLSKRLTSNFEIMYFFLAQMFVISLCFNFVRIFQIISSGKAAKEILLPTIFVVIHIKYLFISNSLGQNMTDHNNYIFATVYRVEWYVTPLHIQKMILFLLLKGSKNFNLKVGLFTPSLECFATLVKASVSYFTVLLSI